MQRVRVNSDCLYLKDEGKIKLGMEGYVVEEDPFTNPNKGQYAVCLPDAVSEPTWAFFDYELDFLHD